jgi:4a-hydroxytetrahydrobiopterin dehydratase
MRETAQNSDYKSRCDFTAHVALRYSSEGPREKRMTELANKTCVPCKGGVPTLKGKELADLARKVRGWKVVEQHHIEKSYNFSDFVSALEFVKAIGAVAEEQGHHPDILLRWGRVTVTIWTHKIDGLTESDFILAAKIDQIPRPPVSS